MEKGGKAKQTGRVRSWTGTYYPFVIIIQGCSPIVYMLSLFIHWTVRPLALHVKILTEGSKFLGNLNFRNPSTYFPYQIGSLYIDYRQSVSQFFVNALTAILRDNS